MNTFSNMEANRNLTAAALKRCHADGKAKRILGAKLMAWDTVLGRARLWNVDKGGSKKYLAEALRRTSDMLRNTRRTGPRSVAFAKDYRGNDYGYTHEADVIEAYDQVFLDAIKMCA